MNNLATRDFVGEINDTVKTELLSADIPVLRLPSSMNTEVKTSYIGLLNGFVFYRAWTYWICRGEMPLEYANEIYDNYKDLKIRAGGHAGNVKPIQMSHSIEYDTELERHFKNKPDNVSHEQWFAEAKKIVDNPACHRFVDIYHIDTLLGLQKLVETIKKYDITTNIIS